MTQFDDRERAFETKFAHDEQMNFRIIARRNRLLGEWGDDFDEAAEMAVRSEYWEYGRRIAQRRRR